MTFQCRQVMPIFISMTLCLSACAAKSNTIRLTGKHYDATVVRHAPITQGQKSAIIADILSRIGGGKVIIKNRKRSQTITPSAKRLSRLHLAMLGGLRIALLSSSRGAEMDIMVRIKGQNPTPVQIIWQVNGNLVMESGTPTTFPARKHGTLNLKFTNGSDRWSAIEKAHVREALALLSPQELAVMQKIPLRRERNKRVSKWAKGGLYEQKGCYAKIRMYSSAFAGRHLKFSGEPKRPRSKTISTILHEVAHALHHAPSRQAYCRLDKRNRSFEKRVRRYNQAIKNTNVNAQRAQLERERAWIETESKTLQRLMTKADALSRMGPVLAAFKRQLGNRKGPTVYGATALEETFAEAFSLFHSDRAALTRIWPDVTTWFVQNKHLTQ
jgi:hypothetical protein